MKNKVKVRVQLKRAISARINKSRRRNNRSSKLRLKNPRNRNKILERKTSRKKGRREISSNNSNYNLPSRSQGRNRRAMKRYRRVRERRVRTIQRSPCPRKMEMIIRNQIRRRLKIPRKLKRKRAKTTMAQATNQRVSSKINCRAKTTQ